MKKRVPITCPDCGPVMVVPDAWSGGKPASGKCPTCKDQLYFEGAMFEPEDFTPLVASLPPQLQVRVDEWMRANEQQKEKLLHGIFPLGMVQRWIERAEKAEAEVKAGANVE